MELSCVCGHFTSDHQQVVGVHVGPCSRCACTGFTADPPEIVDGQLGPHTRTLVRAWLDSRPAPPRPRHHKWTATLTIQAALTWAAGILAAHHGHTTAAAAATLTALILAHLAGRSRH